MMPAIVPNQIFMTRKSKWIESDSLHEPAPAVAQRAIRARLDTVWKWFPLAAEELMGEVENLHQLRVSTRRATAALNMFEAMLPRKRSRWFRKQLKRIRQATSDARDLDVLGMRVGAACQEDEVPGCSAMIERVAAARRAAQPAVCELYRKLRDRRFRSRMKKLVERIQWRSDESEEPTYQVAARAGLRPLAAAFFTAAEADLDNTPALHEFRIAGKELRYAMEVFAAAFEPSFRKELYPIVEELQTKLGAVNDHATHRDQYLAWLDDTTDESQRLLLSKLIATETAALQSSTREFHQWWTTERAADFKARFWHEISAGELRCA
jgi:CHAD domain-containing protein